eukprot:9016285-Lingulodinium_polyedra.AAC.1
MWMVCGVALLGKARGAELQVFLGTTNVGPYNHVGTTCPPANKKLVFRSNISNPIARLSLPV